MNRGICNIHSDALLKILASICLKSLNISLYILGSRYRKTLLQHVMVKFGTNNKVRFYCPVFLKCALELNSIRKASRVI